MIAYPTANVAIASQLALAGLTGLAVGIEREWSGHASGPHARFAGVRTFLLLGLIGGISGWLAATGWVVLGAALIGGAALLAVLAYLIASQQTGERDGTTETAALLVLATGTLCGLGHGPLGSAIAAVAVLALAEKSRIQRLVAGIEETELRAALRFAVLALVVLPLLPEGPYGPYDAIRPRELWTIVLLFSGFNFLGYFARRAAGPDRGYGIAGLLGGLISSTAVTLTFSRQSRSTPQYATSLALGVLAACTVLIPRVLVMTSILSTPTAVYLLRYLVPPALIGALAAYLSLRRRVANEQAEFPERSPLRLLSAIQMVVAFQLVLLAIPAVRQLWGTPGILASAAVLGLTDMDALTYSMARLAATESPSLAARAIAVGLLSNTLLKLSLVLILGAPRFRKAAAPGLLAVAATVVVGLFFWL